VRRGKLQYKGLKCDEIGESQSKRLAAKQVDCDLDDVYVFGARGRSE